MSKGVRLRHLHLPHSISYQTSLRLQETILQAYFTYRTALRSTTPRNHALPERPPPLPTLLTFSTAPTYTVGRRHLTKNPLSPSQISTLTSSLGASFRPSPRGGLLTYHAPGQLTAYPLIDLRTHNITPRCYIRLLENTIIRTCARFNVPNTTTTADPGVWLANKETGEVTDRKICAVGVQVSRGVTSHGIGLNVYDHPIPGSEMEKYNIPDDLTDKNATAGDATSNKPGYLSWGFSRIVACGLEGKTVTWLTREGADPHITSVSDVAAVFADEFAKSLTSDGKVPISGIDTMDPEDKEVRQIILLAAEEEQDSKEE